MKKLKNVMTRDVEVISPDASIHECARKMRDLDVGVIPVCDGTRIHGMITDRDIVVRGLTEGRDLAHQKVSDVMTRDVHYCFQDDDVDDAAELMKSKQIRRLLVLDRDKNLVGIVSLGDIAAETTDKVAGRTLEEVSKPVHGEREFENGFFSKIPFGTIFVGSSILGLGAAAFYFLYGNRGGLEAGTESGALPEAAPGIPQEGIGERRAA